jgi:predicted Zn-dependent protease
MFRHARWFRPIAGMLPALLLLSNCSVNPATGKQQVNFFSEAEEIEMGRQADEEIVAEVGLYDDPELQAYVEELGQELAAQSERPHLPWSFKVLDDPAINAFALPGGYVYVTRGIITHLDSEAELATVIGHEIGHVTARHGVNQMSKQMLAVAGLEVASILSETAYDWAGVAALGMGLIFLKHGRDDERQADELGLRYSQRTGFDLRESSQVFDLLDRASQVEGVGRLPNWLSTHPDPGARRNRVQEKVASLEASGTSFEGTKIERDGYIARLDGMVFGENPREGYFREGEFLHPDLRFRFQFPDGWETANEKASVSAKSPAEDAMVQISLAEQSTPDTAAAAFFEEDGVTREKSWKKEVHGLPASWNRWEATTDDGSNYRGTIAFVSYQGNVFQILAMAQADDWDGYEDDLETAIASFTRLNDGEAQKVQPKTLKVVRLKKAMTLEEFAKAYPSTVDLATLALINHVELGARLEANTLVKRVVG